MHRHHLLRETASRRGAVPRAVVATALGALVIGVAAVGPGAPRAAADAITDKINAAKQALAADGATMTHLRAELAASANQEAALQATIVQLDAQITHTQAQVASAQAQVVDVDNRLAAAQTALAQTKARLAYEQRQLTLEVVVLYKAENDSTDLSNFLNSGDFNSLWQRVLAVDRLNQSEQELIATINSDEQSISAQVAQITTEKAQKVQLLATLNGEEAQLSEARTVQQQAVVEQQQLQARDQQLLAQAIQSTAELHAQIAKLQAEEAAALAAGGGSGKFAWPETGPITQGFGCTNFTFEPGPPPGYPPCPSGHFHWGIDIAAPDGNPVHAADAGIVNLRYDPYGYGIYIVIIHGNGWDSVYGHLSGYVSGLRNGQTVARGQLIGYEGSTGNSSGPHLHFEIDLNNIPKNPLAYLS